MAPINPQQILKAFEPVCSPTGGIINTKEVPKLSSLIKKYSKKMVSKCTYINILLATDENVLEEFLNCNGWTTLFEWLKDAINDKNIDFLLELVDLLDRCPVTLERLKANDIPKLLKILTKSEFKGTDKLSMKAKNLRSKWRELVDKKSNNLNDSNSSDKLKEKRKLKDASNIENGHQLNNVKKLKTSDDGSKSVKTTKCKLGKSRSIGVLEKDSSTTAHTNSKPLNNNHNDHKATHSPVLTNGFTTKGAALVKNIASTPCKPLNKLSESNDKGIQLIDAQPLPITELMNSTSSHSTKHIIKDSTGFMDAISSLPTSSSKIKKKKKTSPTNTEINKQSPSTSNTATTVNANHKSADLDFSNEPMDTSDVNNYNSPNDNKINDENSLESKPLNDEPDFLTFSNPSPYDPLRKPVRGILPTIPRGRRLKIIWPDDSMLERVKYFELDSQERCNVTRQNNNNLTGQNNFDQHRREEMENERNQMMNMRNQSKNDQDNPAPVQYKYAKDNPGEVLMKWVCYPIDFTGIETIVRGTNSEEVKIQRERLKDVLEDIDLPGRPDFPKEPDNVETNLENYQTQIIPLEDENNSVADYSNDSYAISFDPSMNGFPSLIEDNVMQNYNTQYMNNQIPPSNVYNPQQLYMPYSNGNTQQQQLHNDNNRNNNWTSNWEPTTNNQSNHQVNHHSNHNSNHQSNNNHQPNYYNNNNNSNNGNNKFNRSNQSNNKGFGKKRKICNFFASTGKCKFGDKCWHIHQQDNHQE